MGEQRQRAGARDATKVGARRLTLCWRRSDNVSSISDRGTGLFTVNFSTAMTDANYAVNATSGHGSDSATTATARTGGTISTTACHICTGYRSSSSVLADMDYNAVTFFGN